VNGAHKALEEATERHEALSSGHDWAVPLASAIIAVLAALGTMLAHHRSIQALSAKNEAVIVTTRAADRYAYYESQRTRIVIYQALVSAGIPKTPAARQALTKTADIEQTASLAVLDNAKHLEQESIRAQQRSETLLGSFETLEIATTLLEIAIVFTSISALTSSRILLWLGVGLAGVGTLLGCYGFFQAR
jgi:hypothetical protein